MQYGARRLFSELLDNWVGNLEASTVCWRDSARRMQLSAYCMAAVNRVRRVAVEDLKLSQEDQPKGTDQLMRFRMKLPSLSKSAQDNWIIHSDL